MKRQSSLGVAEDEVVVGMFGVVVDNQTWSGIPCEVVKVARWTSGAVHAIDVRVESDGHVRRFWRRPSPGSAAFLVEEEGTAIWWDRPNGRGVHSLHLGDLARSFVRLFGDEGPRR